MKRYSHRIFTVLGLAGLVFAVACGGSGKSGSSDNSGPTATSGGGNSAAASADLRLLGPDPITLDPALTQSADDSVYITEIYSGLVTIDKNLQLAPDLAESLPAPENNPDGTVSYTFKIRKDATFQDGRPVTADDFRYSMERALDPKTASTTAESYLGDIVGAKDMARGRATSASGIQVVDSSTLKLTIDKPKPYFLAELTYPTAFVVDKNQVQSNPRNWTHKPNGTGPYKLQQWRLNELIVLQAYDHWYGGAPPTKTVSFNLAGGSALTQYDAGEIDASGIGINDIERAQSANDPLSKEYVHGPTLTIGYLGFNTQTPPFDDPKVRMAFAKAIDRDQIVKVVLSNLVASANSIMMPGLPGYNKDAQAPTFDPAAAKDLLNQSKYGGAKNLPPITLTEVGQGATAGLDTQAIVQQWHDNLGVDVQIAQSESATFLDDLDQGKLQLYTSGWIMDYPDPYDLIDLLFYSQSRQNNSRYNNPAFDALVVQARTEQDVTKRLQLYQQAEQILLQDVPWMPLYFGQEHMVVKPYVHGLGPLPMQIEQLRGVTVDKH